MPRQSGDQHWTRRRPDAIARGARRLSAEQIAELCAFYRQYRPVRSRLARRYGIGRTTLWRYLRAAGLLD